MYFITLTKLGSEIMGVIINGILGGVSGKVAGVVGSKWKDKSYLRAYAIPANPQSTAQVVQRSRMSQTVFVARQLLGNLIQPYWSKFYSSMSGYNAFIKYNIMHLSDSTYELTTNNVMSRGNLLGVSNLAATYYTLNGDVSVSWENNQNGSTGLSTDLYFLVIVNKDGTVYKSWEPGDTRGDEGTNISIPSGLSASDVIVYLFFYRGSGSALQVSDSSAVVPSAA